MVEGTLESRWQEQKHLQSCRIYYCYLLGIIEEDEEEEEEEEDINDTEKHEGENGNEDDK